MQTVAEKSRNRVRLLQEYTVLVQAQVNFYTRQLLKLSEAEVKERLDDMRIRIELMGIRNAVYEDLLRNSSMTDRTFEEAKARTAMVIEQLEAEDQVKAKGKNRRSALDALKAAVDAAQV